MPPFLITVPRIPWRPITAEATVQVRWPRENVPWCTVSESYAEGGLVFFPLFLNFLEVFLLAQIGNIVLCRGFFFGAHWKQVCRLRRARFWRGKERTKQHEKNAGKMQLNVCFITRGVWRFRDVLTTAGKSNEYYRDYWGGIVSIHLHFSSLFPTALTSVSILKHGHDIS